jgi:hypothetical protein
MKKLPAPEFEEFFVHMFQQKREGKSCHPSFD